MYFFTVGAIFRNESHCIQEWLNHYINEGAEHFYLINDNSTDNTTDRLQPYIDKGLITLYFSNEPHPHPTGHQRNCYNKFILPHLNNKEMKWLLMCDLDEFVWSKVYNTITDFLKYYVAELAQVQIRPTLFGSNNLIKQPDSLIHGFTKRTAEIPTNSGSYKYIVNSDYKFSLLNVHHATPENPEYLDKKYFMIINYPYITMNHYITQSEEFWINVKCTRGDADGFLTRNMELFDGYNSIANATEDFSLANKTYNS